MSNNNQTESEIFERWFASTGMNTVEQKNAARGGWFHRAANKPRSDEPPAFPQHAERNYTAAGWERRCLEAGMTLRDYFAAKAMHAELVTAGASHAAAHELVKAARENERIIEEQIALNAYVIADWMMLVREGRLPA